MGRKPLGIVREIAEASGMGISYAYDDLVFIDHNAFLLQFTDKDDEVLVHINTEAEEQQLGGDLASLKKAAAARNMTWRNGGYYMITQADDEHVCLEFLKSDYIGPG